MRGVLTCGVAALLAACAPMPATTATSADMVATPLEAVGLTINSWGVPLHDWRIAADGSGSYTYAEHKEGRSDFEAPLVTKHLAGTPADFARIAALLADAERYARGETLQCRREITDMPYGDISWQRGGETATLRYDLGCRGADAEPVYTALGAAQDAVAALAADAPVVARRPRTR